MGKVNKGGYLGGFDQLRAPDAPTIGAATAGNTEVSVAFTAASNAGAGTVSSFVVTGVASGVSTGATGTSSPVTVTGLTNGTNVTFSVIAISEFGASPSSGTVEASPNPLNARAIFSGGRFPNTNVIQQVEIATTANATDFGDLSQTRIEHCSPSSTTRGLSAGGYFQPPASSNSTINIIEFITIASASNTTDFGDLTVAKRAVAPVSNDTVGLVFGGELNNGDGSPTNDIDKVVIASTGNATDFGNLDASLGSMSGGQSTTRGLMMGGDTGNLNNLQQDIHYVTIASAGNVIDFGNLLGTNTRATNGPICSNTRCLHAGGVIDNSFTKTNVIQFFVTASTGNATDFGDLSGAKQQTGGASSHTRALIAAGDGTSGGNVIEFVTIATEGNVTDFGDLLLSLSKVAGLSGAHGGLAS